MTLGVFQVGNLDEKTGRSCFIPYLIHNNDSKQKPKRYKYHCYNYAAASDDKKNIFFLIREKKACHATSTREFKGGWGGGSVSHRVNLAIYKNSHNFFFLISLLSFFPWL